MSTNSNETMESTETKWVSHYSSQQKLLLVGEGDFSFSSCLATKFGTANLMVATSLDSINELHKKYGTDATTNTSNLVNRGALVLHDFDACHMATEHATSLCVVKQMLFDRIVFNFPHAGFPSTQAEEAKMMQKHKELMRLFFTNARCMLLPNGEVHVSHKLGDANDKWKLEEHAQAAGLRLLRKVPFEFDAFPGYRTRRGAAKEAGKRFPVGEAATYIFCKNDADEPPAPRNFKVKFAELCARDYSGTVADIANVKTKLVEKGRAREGMSAVQALVNEVARLDKLEMLGKKKMMELKTLKSALKIVKVAVLEDNTLDLALLFQGSNSKVPKCFQVCEFCGAELKRSKANETKNMVMADVDVEQSRVQFKADSSHDGHEEANIPVENPPIRKRGQIHNTSRAKSK